MGGVALLGVAGCGGGDGGQEEESVQTRSVEHAAGTTEVPIRPERVAATIGEVPVHLASVGLVVTAAPEDVMQRFEGHSERVDPDLDLSDIALIGTEEEPNLEQIAETSPDLIIIPSSQEQLYEQMSRIAPTILLNDYLGSEWKGYFDQTIEAAGRSEEAEEIVAGYQETLAASSSGNAGEIEISCIRPREGGTFRIDLVSEFSGSVFREAGYAVTEAPPGSEVLPGAGNIDLSGEQLGVVTGDVIITPTFDADADTISQFERNPLWRSLPAVRANWIITVPDAVYDGESYISAQLLLDAVTDAGVSRP